MREEVERQEVKEELKARHLSSEKETQTFLGKVKTIIIEFWLEGAVSRRPTNEKIGFILNHLTGDAFEEVQHLCWLDVTSIKQIYVFEQQSVECAEQKIT